MAIDSLTHPPFAASSSQLANLSVAEVRKDLQNHFIR